MTPGPYRILVAEDSFANRELITEILGLHGYEITVAENGGAAIACLENGGYDLVLLDIQMPVLDGYPGDGADACSPGMERHPDRGAYRVCNAWRPRACTAGGL